MKYNDYKAMRMMEDKNIKGQMSVFDYAEWMQDGEKTR